MNVFTQQISFSIDLIGNRAHSIDRLLVSLMVVDMYWKWLHTEKNSKKFKIFVKNKEFWYSKSINIFRKQNKMKGLKYG